jgi:hypothetical protein
MKSLEDEIAEKYARKTAQGINNLECNIKSALKEYNERKG